MPLALALWLAALPPLPILHGADEIFAMVRQTERPTVVHFWATWCDECVRELPEVRRLEQGLARQGAAVLWISLDSPEDTEKVVAFMRQHHLAKTAGARSALLDAPDPEPITARFSPRWHAGLPATFVVLESGEVAASHLGPTPVDVVLKEVQDRMHAPPGTDVPVRRTK